MGKRATEGQSGGVNIGGSVGSVGGDIVGRDKVTGAPSAAALDGALRPLIEAIRAAPAETRAEAEAKLVALKQETAKGEKANDGVIAKLVDGLVGLVPGAASAVVSAFATPVLGGHRRPGHRLRARQVAGQVGTVAVAEPGTIPMIWQFVRRLRVFPVKGANPPGCGSEQGVTTDREAGEGQSGGVERDWSNRLRQW